MKKSVLIGVCGGIAAYKILELIPRLRKRGIDVSVIMTGSATKMIDPHAFEKASGNHTYHQLFRRPINHKTILATRRVEHIDVAKKADLFLIAPATANTIAKLATGIADDYLTTVALALTCPVVICPAMNARMWDNPVTQKNVGILHDLGMHIVGPEKGRLACGDAGGGRLAPIEIIEEEVVRFIHTSKSLTGKRVIVTAGGTIEPVDAVRVLTNRSSGKMGTAIAEACMFRGAEVLLVRSQTSISSRYGIREVIFDTAESLQAILEKHLPSADICIHAAAVSDFKIAHPMKEKTSSTKPLSLELTPQTKILDTIKQVNPDICLVAFKAEYRVPKKHLLTIAKNRLASAQADMIVANDIGRKNQGFQSDYNEVSIVGKNGKTKHIPRATKAVIANAIIDELVQALG
jgi:phosphopantothenoylcysteine decarboxylase/phosphopantothenate--cysteine ligase